MTTIEIGRAATPANSLHSQPSALSPFFGPRPLKLSFWLRLALETAGQRRVRRLVEARMRDERLVVVDGLACIPVAGAFVLAVNHYSGRPAFDTAGAVLSALARVRPDSVDQMTVIVGQKRITPRNRVQAFTFRLVRGGVDAVFRRWDAHAIRIPLKNPEPTPAGLREWRERAKPVFVFPEGKAGVAFGAIRRGAGRWLASLGQQVVPVGVYWKSGEGWTVRFGPPMDWTHRADLRDVQLGLAMAALLPAALAPGWQADLARWRAAHQPR
jgi:hypothetical protein